MNHTFLIIDSMTILRTSYKSIINIFAEYNAFRLDLMTHYRPNLVKDIYGPDIDHQMKMYKESALSGEPYEGFFDFLNKKFQNYFKYFLIQEGSTAIGQASIETYADDIAILHRVYTRPAYRRKHYGYLLLEKIVQTAYEDGFSKMYLDTIPVLSAAIKMYEKIGFKHREYYPAPYFSREMAKEMDTVFMECDLPIRINQK